MSEKVWPKSVENRFTQRHVKDFNEVLCVEYFYLGKHRAFHGMDSKGRYSVGAAVSDTKMNEVTEILNSLRFSPFRAPKSILCDPAIDNTEFKNFPTSQALILVYSRGVVIAKNVIESKQ